MLKIIKTSRKQIKTFNKKEWHGVDIEHYGKAVEWKEKEFIYKAVENEKIVGTITGKFESGVLYIGSVIVAKDKRDGGIGEELFKKAESFGKKIGAHKAWLITGKGWKAEKFYKKIGYERTGILENHNFHRDFAIYEKDLK